MPVNGIALAAGAAGITLAWSAINNQSILTGLKDVISGRKPQPGSAGGPQPATSPVSLNANAGIPGVTQGIPAGVAAKGSPSANKALGLMMAAAYGWAGPGEWPYLSSGWQEESRWSEYAANPASQAYGIPQANPGSKMASAGSDWKTSPSTQIKWGLGYIKSTYGAPSRVPGWTPNGPVAGYVGY
jgi:hypothetical protein